MFRGFDNTSQYLYVKWVQNPLTFCFCLFLNLDHSSGQVCLVTHKDSFTKTLFQRCLCYRWLGQSYSNHHRWKRPHLGQHHCVCLRTAGVEAGSPASQHREVLSRVHQFPVWRPQGQWEWCLLLTNFFIKYIFRIFLWQEVSSTVQDIIILPTLLRYMSQQRGAGLSELNYQEQCKHCEQQTLMIVS